MIKIIFRCTLLFSYYLNTLANQPSHASIFQRQPILVHTLETYLELGHNVHIATGAPINFICQDYYRMLSWFTFSHTLSVLNVMGKTKFTSSFSREYPFEAAWIKKKKKSQLYVQYCTAETSFGPILMQMWAYFWLYLDGFFPPKI